MSTMSLPSMVSSGRLLKPVHTGWLCDSSPLLSDVSALRRRMDNDGYLFLPGLLHRQEVLGARRVIVEHFASQGYLRPGSDPMDAIINPEAPPLSAFRDRPPNQNSFLMRVLYDGPLMAFFARFLGGEIRHFDFTWMRSVFPGHGTPSHCDSVYMNRGTQNLFTAWTPLGDIDTTLGGLMILAGSHRNQRLKNTYGKQDVDAYCENRPDAQRWGRLGGSNGWLMGNPNTICRGIAGPQGRWFTADFRAGDVLIFTMYTVHASLDNCSPDRIRFSSDSRYQRADEPADQRWIGQNPVGHGQAGKRGKIC